MGTEQVKLSQIKLLKCLRRMRIPKQTRTRRPIPLIRDKDGKFLSQAFSHLHPTQNTIHATCSIEEEHSLYHGIPTR